MARVQFDVEGVLQDGRSFHLYWTIPSDKPVPDVLDPPLNPTAFELLGPITYHEVIDGVQQPDLSSGIWFYSTAGLGGVTSSTRPSQLSIFGVQLYQDPMTAPTFVPLSNWAGGVATSSDLYGNLIATIMASSITLLNVGSVQVTGLDTTDRIAMHGSNATDRIQVAGVSVL